VDFTPEGLFTWVTFTPWKEKGMHTLGTTKTSGSISFYKLNLRVGFTPGWLFTRVAFPPLERKRNS